MRELILLMVLGAASVGPAAADDLTWKEANRRSAEALRGGDADAGAEFARQAFDLYAAQSARYNAATHAQLLLNLVDARQKAADTAAALRELDRGTAALREKAGEDSPDLVALFQEGARLAGSLGAKKAFPYHQRAADQARSIWGDDDLRVAKLDFVAAEEGRTLTGYRTTRRRLHSARSRAAKAANGRDLLFAIDMALAKLEVENKTPREAIPLYESLREQLVARNEPAEKLVLQAIDAQLEYAYEMAGLKAEAAAVHERMVASFAGDNAPLVPLKRIAPRYPTTSRSGYVLLRLTVAPDGTVRDQSVVAADPPGVFENAAMAAVAQWTFAPRIVDGQPVEQTGLQRIDFRLDR